MTMSEMTDEQKEHRRNYMRQYMRKYRLNPENRERMNEATKRSDKRAAGEPVPLHRVGRPRFETENDK